MDGTDHTNRVYLKLNESIKIDGDVVRTMLRIFVKKNVVYWCPLYEIVSLNKIFREIYYNDKLEISMGYTAVGFCPVVVFKSQSLKIIEKGTILVKIINLEEIFELKRDKKTPAVESEPSSV